MVAERACHTIGPSMPESVHQDIPITTIVREWGRIGAIGFGGPPAHIALFRQLCVDERQWLTAHEFEDGIAATNLLPGPASTQLAIYCAWRLRGRFGRHHRWDLFHLPGLILILGLSAVFLAATRRSGSSARPQVLVPPYRPWRSTPPWVLLPASWHRVGTRRAVNDSAGSLYSLAGWDRPPTSGPSWSWCSWSAAQWRSLVRGRRTRRRPGRPARCSRQ